MYTPVQEINKNSKSAYVYAWQKFLYDKGFKVVGTPDSLWGHHTTEGSQEFQKSCGLTDNGIVGQGTIHAAQARGFEFPIIKNLELPGQSNVVIDISHYQSNVNFTELYNAGIRAVIHKSTQGTNSHKTDPMYNQHKTKALAAGLLWGAYHFSIQANATGGGSGREQANFFLQNVGKHGDTVLALDWENIGDEKMSATNATEFVSTIFESTGKYPLLYSRTGFINESRRTQAQLEILQKCPLWLSAYSWSAPEHPAMPRHLPIGWEKYTLWQFSDGNYGQGAVPVAGVGECDRDIFNGTEADLKAFWAANQV